MKLIFALGFLFSLIGGSAWAQSCTGSNVENCPGPVVYKGPVQNGMTSGPAVSPGDFNASGNYKVNGVPASTTVNGTNCPLGGSCSPSASNSAQYLTTSYTPTGYVLGTLTSSNPTPISAYFPTCAAANSFFGSSVCSATTDYLDRAIVQATINAAANASTGYAQVILPPGGSVFSGCGEYWDHQVTYDGSKVTVAGSGATGSIATIVCTQTIGAGTAAVSATGGSIGNLNGKTVLQDIGFCAWNLGYLPMPAGGGTAKPGSTTRWNGVTGGYYLTGSIAVQIDNANIGVMRNVSFTNYDTPQAYATGNVYIWTFENFFFNSNNNGPYIGGPLSNSFENMRWHGGATGNNNNDVYLAPGNNGGSLFVEDMSIDYPNVWEIYYDGSGGGNTPSTPLYVTRNHIETSSVATGTAPRIFNSGALFLTDNKGDEEGPTLPVGWIAPTFFARESLVNNTVPGQGAGGIYVPAVYLPGGAVAFTPACSGNSTLYGGDVICYQDNTGNLMDDSKQRSVIGNKAQDQTTAYSLALQNQGYRQIVSGGPWTVTMPTDTTAGSQIISTVFEFVTADSAIYTFAAGNGTATFGGSAGIDAKFIKTAGNTWTRLQSEPQGGAPGLNNALTFACGIPIGDGGTHTVSTAPAGSCFHGLTTLAQLAAITINGINPFFFLTDNGTITGPMGTYGSTTNPFTSGGGSYALTNSSVANLDIGWLAIQAALLTGKTYIPAGNYKISTTTALPLMWPLSSEGFGTIQGVPTTMLGDGARISYITAGQDYGAGIPLIACGDPSGTASNTLGRYGGNNGMCSGDMVRIGFFAPSACGVFNAAGTEPCFMTGIAGGSRLRDLDVESVGFGEDYGLVGDQTEHIRLHLTGGAKGLRLDAPSATNFGAQQFLGFVADGQSIASISVAPGASLAANFNGQTYLSGQYAILGEAASGGNCTPILQNATFDLLFTETIGNETIADDSGFGSQTSSLTATNASPAVFTGTDNVYYNGNTVVLSGGTAPAGFASATTYYVVNATPASGTFNLSATRGGSAKNSTSTGSGFSGTSGVYTDANKCRAIQSAYIRQWAGSFSNSQFDTVGSGRGRRATFDVSAIDMNISQIIGDGFSLTPNDIAATNGPPAVAFINANEIGDLWGGVTLGGDLADLISQLGALPIAGGDSNVNDYNQIRLNSALGWSGAVGYFQSSGNYTTTVAGDIMELTQYLELEAGGSNFISNQSVAGIAMQSGITNNQTLPYAFSGSVNVNTGWNTTFWTLLGKSTGLGKTLTLAAGSGYTNGTYTWTATGGGCSTEPIGTVTVSGNALTSATIGATTQGVGCTSGPTIPIPGGAGAGSGGSITPRWPSGLATNLSTPLTVGFIGQSVGGNNAVGGGANFLITRLQGLQ